MNLNRKIMNDNVFFSKEGIKTWRRKALLIPLAFVLFIFLFSFIAMYLWNNILPIVIGVHTITFWQTLGIIILARILFGGFPYRHKGPALYAHKNSIREKWNQLSPEQKEKIRRGCWGKFEEPNQPV